MKRKIFIIILYLSLFLGLIPDKSVKANLLDLQKVKPGGKEMTQNFQVRLSMNQAAIVKSGLVLKQGDFGMNLEIEVLNFDTSNTTPQIVFRKPMGAVESTSVTKSGNVYTYTLRGTELDTPGKVICDLKLKNSTTQRLSTASFSFEVVADTLDGLAEEASSYSDTIAQIVGGFDDEILAIQTTLNSLEKSASVSTAIADNKWIPFEIENGHKIKVTNGSSRITGIGVTAENWGANIQTFGELAANKSAIYTVTVDNAKYVHFWATDATSVTVEDYSLTIPEIEQSIIAIDTKYDEITSALVQEVDNLNRSTSKTAPSADNYWVKFPLSNGGKVKITNTGANRITAIGVTTAEWGSNVQTFGNLDAGKSGIYTVTVDNANYIRFWATGATSILIEDYDTIIPQIITEIDADNLPDPSKTVAQNISDMTSAIVENANSIIALSGDIQESNTRAFNSYDKVSIASNKEYFTVAFEKDGVTFKQNSPLELSSNTDITSIEIYRSYSLPEIGTGKTLTEGSKVSALYGTSQPSEAVWNAILFKSADYNGETYIGQNADYYLQYTGSAIQLRHVLPGGSSTMALQFGYGQITKLSIPMQVVQINSSAINIKNAIPADAADVVVADINNQQLSYISSDDLVYAKGATSLHYTRYVDLLGKSTVNRIRNISGYYTNGVIVGDQVGFISVYDVRESLKAYITGRVFNTHDYYDLLDSNFNVISYLNNSSGSAIWISNYEVDVSGAAYICVSNNNNESTVKVEGCIKNSQESAYLADKTNSVWNGKVVAWLGTSIPASGGYNNTSNTASYPLKLARELGFTCYNMAIGGSCVHCKSPDRISEINPYGFANDFDLVSKCITNTSEEMEWIIDNFQSEIFTVNRHDSLSDSLKANIRATSYEVMLPTLFNYDADLIVFNYGWNDGGLTLDQDKALITQYGEETLYCYTGAMNFLLRKIYENDPHQAVAMVGEIREHSMNEHEEYVASQWLIPFYDLYNKCGFSSKQITTTGYWDNNHVWIESGGQERTVYIYQTWLYDNIHPHSSMDGRALERITKCLVPFFMNDLREVLAH